jgi:hypothetical protein
MPDVHPASVELAPAMKLTLLAWFAPVLMLTAGLIVAKTSLNCRAREARSRAVEAGAAFPEIGVRAPSPARAAGGVS